LKTLQAYEVIIMELTVDGFKRTRYNFFKTRYEMDFTYKIAAALLLATFTGLMAQVRIYLPFTPVPITGQVFPALLAGFVLGKWYGGMSQLLYAVIGGLGLPWFAPKVGKAAFTSGGVNVLLGPTGGYIAGFILASFLIGHLTDTYLWSRRIVPQLAIMLSGVALIYTTGAIQFYYFAKSTPALQNWVMTSLGSSTFGFKETMAAAVLPFIPVDVLKAIGAALLGSAILPKKPFAAEKDATTSS
jgi:biotin transport system substrate-specific component